MAHLTIMSGRPYTFTDLFYLVEYVELGSNQRLFPRVAGWFKDLLVLVYPTGEALGFYQVQGRFFYQGRVWGRDRLMAHLITGYPW